MLKINIEKDLKKALREKREIELSTLRMLLAAINNRETEKRTKIWKKKPETSPEGLETESQLTEDEIIEVIFSEIKRRKEAIEGFEKGKRQDLVEKEKKEMEVLQKYLPEQLSEEEIKKLAKETIKQIGAKETKDMGKVMAELMPRIKGRADGSLAPKIVKDLLGKNEPR